MINVNIRKQGGAAVITIPSGLLKLLDVEVGTALELDIADGVLTARPARGGTQRRRYSLAELLRGATPKKMAALNAETAWARDGEAVGREIT